MANVIQDVPVAVKRRLPRYLRALYNLKKMNTERISSGQLSNILGYTASQIRQDLNHFGGFGQQGYGYNVPVLYDEIAAILGVDKKYNIAIIGCGRLGQAIVNHFDSNEINYHVCGIFDINEDLIGKKFNGVTVQDQVHMVPFLKENDVDLIALCVNQGSAQKVVDMIADTGVKGILNFATMDLSVPDHIKVENVYISEFLQILTYDINHM